ncbi:MAG: IS256 family transposase [Dehalococcoidia bacterium]|nr:IS256 family transposase [Dehalococcoidia bacterium]
MEHLGYEKHAQYPKDTVNRRNGLISKKLRTERSGELIIDVPRDREGSFEPQVVRKGQNDVSEIQDKVMSMYAKGLSDRDISTIIKDIYGFAMSHETISRIVERVTPRFDAWQSRELEAVYAFVYVDAMVVKVKDEGKAINKAVYSVLGIDMQGHKDVLGLWISNNEGAHFWMMIFDELRARGVQRMLFVCVDGLRELEQGVLSIFPQTHVQRCMVHLQRNSLKYIPTKHYKAFCSDAKAIYSAVSIQAAKQALAALKTNWADYPSAVRVWADNFEHVEKLFELPAPIRKMVYTTNVIEALNSAMRKVTRGKAAFPNSEAVFKAFFLRIMDITKKWTMPIPNWALVLGQIDILYPDLL